MTPTFGFSEMPRGPRRWLCQGLFYFRRKFSLTIHTWGHDGAIGHLLEIYQRAEGVRVGPQLPPGQRFLHSTACVCSTRLCCSIYAEYSSSYSLKGLQRLVPDTIDERRFHSLCQLWTSARPSTTHFSSRCPVPRPDHCQTSTAKNTKA